jgi:hypothetical protein
MCVYGWGAFVAFANFVLAHRAARREHVFSSLPVRLWRVNINPAPRGGFIFAFVGLWGLVRLSIR